ncbi:Na+:solute symporter [soil metagenome]
MLATLDWIIIVAFLLLSLAIGLYYRKRASGGMADFFLGGRNLPWYIAGISMVATTFAADTPLAVTGLVAKNGISGNWLWWNMLAGGMLTTFFFARLWRRSGVITEVELIELRYSGKEAAFLRGLKAVYLGLFMNVIIIGWVNVALASILIGMFGIEPDQVIWYIAGAMLIAATYSTISGLWGVAVTDVVQFTIAMTGTVILAFLVVNSEKIGGISGLQEKLADKPWAFEFFPSITANQSATDVGSTLAISIGAFLAFIGVQWWSSWYPGAEPGGGGYVAQRMMSAKDENQAVYATLLFQVAHYCLRPWPWILVALCTLVLYPGLEKPGMGYIYAMNDFLPVGLKGLLVVAFLAAYLSTISTQLNWGAGYLVNDLYKRFSDGKESHNQGDGAGKEARFEAGVLDIPLKNTTRKSDKELLTASRLATIFLCVLGIAVTPMITSIEGTWQFIMECGAGLGLVLILRWYWWRINAWSEITATLAPFVGFAISKFGLGWEFPNSFFLTVGFTTVSWLVVTYLTQPTNRGTLQAFYAKVQPGGWWAPISSTQPEGFRPGYLALCWLSGITFTYSMLFGIGKLIFADYTLAAIWLVTAMVALALLRFGMGKTKVL